MLFDELCGIVERHFTSKRKMLEEARLFRMERVRSDGRILTGKWEPEERVIENFRTPFATIAIEDAPSRDNRGGICFVLKEIDPKARTYDLISLNEGGRVATARLRAFPNAWLLDGSWEAKVADVTKVAIYEGCKKSGLRLVEQADFIDAEVTLTKGEGMEIKTEDGHCRLWELEDSPNALDDLKKQVGLKERAIVFVSCCLAIMEVVAISDPSRFVVEETTEFSEKPFKSDKIRRSCYRPHFITLRPRDIKTRLIGEPHDGESVKHCPHERRGHYRRLQSSRFVNKCGQILWIKPTWIGPVSGKVGKNKYRVRLDV